MWNDITRSFRDDDLLSNREMDLLRFRFAEGVGGLDVYLPIFLSAGMIDKVIGSAKAAAARWRELSGEEDSKRRKSQRERQEQVKGHLSVCPSVRSGPVRSACPSGPVRFRPVPSRRVASRPVRTGLDRTGPSVVLQRMICMHAFILQCALA